MNKWNELIIRNGSQPLANNQNVLNYHQRSRTMKNGDNFMNN